jgi:hypothetical protein
MKNSVKSAISEALEVAFTAPERGHDCSVNFFSANGSVEIIFYPHGFNVESAQFYTVVYDTGSCLATQDPAATIREIMSRIVEQMDALELEVRGEDF